MRRAGLLIAFLSILPASCQRRPDGGPAAIGPLPGFEPDLRILDFAEPPPAHAPRRIVCLVPSCTEVLFALGLGERVVGVDRWADQPPEVAKLPRLGDVARVATERILDLSPDLVILFECQDDTVDLFHRAGIAVLVPPTEVTMFGSIEAVARAAGVADRGEVLIGRLGAEAEILKNRYSGIEPVRTLLVFERIPRISVPTGRSFYSELFALIAAVNVAAGAHPSQAFAWASVEQVLEWSPQVIIDLTSDESGARAAEGAAFWGSLPTGASRIHGLHAPVLARPGPRIVDAARYLAECIHGF